MKFKFIVLLAGMLFGLGSSEVQGKCGCSINLIAKLAQDIIDQLNIIGPRINNIQIFILQNISISEQIITNISVMEQDLLSAIENINCSIGDVVVTATVDLTPIISLVSANDQIIISLLEEIDNKCDPCSRIDVLENTVSVNDSRIISILDEINNQGITVSVSIGCDLCSQLDVLENTVSVNDSRIISILDEINNQGITVSVSIGCDICSQLDVIETEISVGDAIINSKIGDLDQSGTCLESMIDVPDDINNLNLTIIQLLKTILLELRGCGGC